MVTFETSFSEVGRRLSLLTDDPDPVPADVLEAALAARHSTLRLLDALAQHGVLGLLHTDRANVAELARNPTGVFNQQRRAIPVLPTPFAHVMLSAEPRTEVEGLWLGVHRHAVVARHEWLTADPSTRPAGPAAWTLTADGAAMTAALVLLEPTVARTLHAAGRTDQGRQVAQVTWSGIHQAIHAVWQLAHAGRLEDPTPVRPTGIPKPVAVRSPLGQREAAARLLTQVGETHMTPGALRETLEWHRRTLVAATRLVGPGKTADALLAHARAIQAVRQRLVAVNALSAPDGRPLAQARALCAFVTDELTGGRRPDVGMEVARQAGPLITTVTATATAQAQGRRWLIADGTDEAPDRPLWVPTDPHDHRPDVLDRLTDAITTGAAVTDTADPDPLRDAIHARRTPPRRTLAPVVDRVTAPPVGRPARPGTRLAPPTGSRHLPPSL